MNSAAALLALLGFFGGFFAVPLNAAIQHRPDSSDKGGVIAAANFWSFVGIFLAAGAYNLFSARLHQSAAAIFLDCLLYTSTRFVSRLRLAPAATAVTKYMPLANCCRLSGFARLRRV